MKPSSAMAFVSAMPGLVASIFAACEIASSLPQPATIVVAAMRSTAGFRNLDRAALMVGLRQDLRRMHHDQYQSCRRCRQRAQAHKPPLIDKPGAMLL